MENTRRKAHNAAFKLMAIKVAVKEGNRAAARKFNVNESMVRRWIRQREELSRCKKTTKAFRGQKSRWPDLENVLEDWVNAQRARGRGVSSVQIRLKAKTIATEKKIDDFKGGPSWCFRFLRRKGLSNRARTSPGQQPPPCGQTGEVNQFDMRRLRQMQLGEFEESDAEHSKERDLLKKEAESESPIPAEISQEPQSHPTNAELSSPTEILVKAEDGDQGYSPDQHKPEDLQAILVKAEDDDQGYSPDQHKPGPSVPQQSSTEPPPSPALSQSCSVTDSPPCTSTAIFPGPPEAICVVLLSSPPCSPPVVHPLKSDIDAVSFWKSCNTAGCTQAIFAGFIHEMNEISSRIWSEQASQEDYDLALKVITVSGKLTQLVAKQQQELQRKQTELTKAAAAMNEVISALKR